MDTIAAIATPMAPSGIGVLRLSGPQSAEILDKVFTPDYGGPMRDRKPKTLVYGSLRDTKGQLLDRCLATISRGPASYTGEDTAELQCHGSPVALALGLEALFAAGARQALPGEFTRRAFLAGKLDLTRAEAVADLIHAETPAAVRQAAGQLSGTLARKVEGMYDILTDLCAHYYAVLDYPDEDIDPFTAQEMAETLEQVSRELDALASTYQRAKAVNEGVPCAIVGRPNSGKSTLFNALLGRERAIVTEIPGTTRDTVEERLTVGEITLRLIDTAGLRETEDPVERLGVARSRAAMEGAELILVVLDGASPFAEEDGDLIREARKLAPVVLVCNKEDLPPVLELPAEFGDLPKVVLSARSGEGLDGLERQIAVCFPGGSAGGTDAVLANARQMEAAARAREALRRGASALLDGLTPDAVVADVEEAMEALGEITGKSVSEDVTNRIFQRFCVGK